MKRLFLFIGVLALSLAGCKKSEISPTLNGSALIAFNAQVNARVVSPSKSIFSGTVYSNETFGMFAYGTLAGNWESDGNLANPIMGSTSGSAPIEISEVSGTWRASNGKSYFWPESPNGKISFFGFSPFKVASGSELNASFSKGDGVKFTNYVNSVADAKVTDLMFTTPAIDRTYTSNDVFMGELALEFNHALTQVVFSVKSLETYPNVNINVKSITLKDISSVGSFCSLVSSDSDNWSVSASEKLDYVVFDGSDTPDAPVTPFSVSSTATNIGEPLVMIPQDAMAKCFELVYEVEGTGIATETITKLIALGKVWEMGKKVNCNIVIGLNEITFEPVVVEWDTPVNVNVADAGATYNTQSSIIYALDKLNDIKTNFIGDGNTDKCVFSVNVPSGATGYMSLFFNYDDNFNVGDIIAINFDAVGDVAPVINTIPGWEISGSLVANSKGVIVMEKKKDVKAMRFTIDTRKVSGDVSFIVPLTAMTLSGFDLIIYWGDGTSDKYLDGSLVNQSSLTKRYSNGGEYTISVASTQTSYTQKQIPIINFYANYNTINTNDNSSKLISFETPILRMATNNLNNIFNGCISLVSIPSNLFIHNPQTEYFTKAFKDCSSLAVIPAALFTDNKLATGFSETFYGCSKAQLNPNIFCNEDTEHKTFFADRVMDLTRCFSIGSNYSGARGTAPALWTYSMNSASEYTGCFTGQSSSSLTNYGNIPDSWK